MLVGSCVRLSEKNITKEMTFVKYLVNKKNF